MTRLLQRIRFDAARCGGSNPTCRGRRSGFSLVEMIVVIVIIGIITAIAIPRFSRGVGGSGAAALHQNLAVIQGALEHYALEHGNVYPGFNGDGVNAAHTEASLLLQMTLYTDSNGKAQANRNSLYRNGPYLRQGMPPLPVGPNAGASGVQVVTGAAVPAFVANASIGWIYNDTTGVIIPNLTVGDAAKVNVDRMLKGQINTRNGG